MTLRDDLIAAKALIDTPEKWGKEDYEPAPGCYCIFGAYAKVKGVEPSGAVEVGEFNDELSAALPSSFIGVVYFNDHPTTTHADVMALFDRAIAIADRETGTVERLVAERDEALAWISDATKMITEATGGGSELFIRKGEVYRADLPFCKKRLRERHSTLHDEICKAVEARRAVEAELTRLKARADAADELTEALEADEPFGFDPATGFMHANDGGAPGSCIFYVPADHLDAIEAKLATAREALEKMSRSLDAEVSWHRCACPHPCEDYLVHPGPCGTRAAESYRNIKVIADIALRSITEGADQ